jgi:hypothetical protein
MKTMTTTSRITRGIVIPRIRPRLAPDPLPSFVTDFALTVVECERALKSGIYPVSKLSFNCCGLTAPV